jgi:hypothetical protein
VCSQQHVIDHASKKHHTDTAMHNHAHAYSVFRLVSPANVLLLSPPRIMSLRSLSSVTISHMLNQTPHHPIKTVLQCLQLAQVGEHTIRQHINRIASDRPVSHQIQYCSMHPFITRSTATNARTV